MLARAFTAYSRTVLPLREFRLLLEGIKNWVHGISPGGRKSSCLGLITGDPGQGKSLLVQALQDSCEELGLQVLGGSFHGGACAPGGAFVDVVEQIVEAAGRRSAGSPHGRALERFGADLRKLTPDSAWPVECAELPSLGFRQDRLRLVDSLARALLEIGRREPTVLILDEAAAGDTLSRDIFHHLLRILEQWAYRRSRHRLLVVATHTDDGGAQTAPWHFSEVEDSKLLAFRVRARGYSRDDIRECERRVGVDLTLSQREKVHRLTRGNVRHVRWLLESLERGGPGTKAIEREGPALARRLIRESYEALPPEARATVRTLAVLGPPIPLADLARIMAHDPEVHETSLPQDPDGWLAFLRDLQGAGWVRYVSCHPSASDRRVAAHDDVAPVVVARDGRGAVEECSRRIGTYLLGPEPPGARESFRAVAQLLHEADLESLFERGSRSDGPGAWRSGREEQLLRLVHQAADTAEALGCPHEALELVENACRVLGSDGAGGRTEQRILRLLAESGNYREAYEVRRRTVSPGARGEEAAADWRTLGDLCGELDEAELQIQCYASARKLLGGQPAGLETLRVIAGEARLHRDRGDLDESWKLCRRGLEVLQGLGGDLTARCPELFEVAQDVAYRRHDHDSALELEKSLLTFREGEGDVLGLVESWQHMARLSFLRDDLEAAELALKHSLEEATGSGSRLLQATALLRLGEYSAECGSLQPAHRFLVQARSVFRDFDCHEEIQRTEKRLVDLELRLGRFRTAARTIGRVVECAYGCDVGVELEDEEGADSHTLGNAEARRARARRRSRREELEAARKNLPESLTPTEILELAELWTAAGRVAPARRLVNDGLEGREFAGRSDLRAAAQRSVGRLELLGGRLDRAMACYESCLNSLSASPDRPTLGGVYIDVGALLLERGHLGQSFDYTLRGLDVFVDLGDPAGLLRSLHELTTFFLETSQGSAAALNAVTAVSLARSSRAPDEQKLAAYRLSARSASELGDVPLADLGFRRARRLDELLGQPIESSRLRLEAGWHEVRLGHFETAMQLVREGTQLARSSGLGLLVDEFLHLAGVIEGAADNPNKHVPRALEFLERALAGAETQRRPYLRWNVLRSMGRVYEGHGKRELADELKERADDASGKSRNELPEALGKLRWACRESPQNFCRFSPEEVLSRSL
ncbi:MAG: ATP-binding protein [Planctomycetota bacterium]|nr:ATP-binding protein [Planctomycetota bacterium]